MFKTSINMFTLLASLTGCAAHFEPKNGEPRANLNLKNYSRNSSYAAIFSDPAGCSGRTLVNTGHGGVLAQSALPTGVPVSIQIHADRLFSLNMGSTREGATPDRYFSCESVVSFVPKADASYIAEFKYSWSQCGIEVLEEKGGVIIPVQVKNRPFIRGSFGTRCAD